MEYWKLQTNPYIKVNVLLCNFDIKIWNLNDEEDGYLL